MAVTSEIARVRQALAGSAPASSDYDLNPGVTLPEARRLRPAAVLMPIIETDRGARVILTKRSARLKHHPGQVAFPGGRIEDSDAGAAAAALRESHEEIGLYPQNVELLGQLPPHETVTGYTVTPFVGLVRAPFTPVPEAGEVAEVFRVPLAFLMAPGSYRVERRRWRGAWRSYYVAPYGPYYIWGATARMLKGLADRGAS